MASFLATYLRDIAREPLLTAAGERWLARVRDRETETTYARDTLVTSNLRLVVRIAHSFTGRGVPLEDLIAEGNLGLFRAAKDFDPDKGRYTTHASSWVKQQMARCTVHDSPRPVRVPQHAHDLAGKYRKARAALRERTGVEPATEEVAAALGLRPGQLCVLWAALRVPLRVPRGAGATAGRGGGEVAAVFLSPDYRTPAAAEAAERAEAVRAVLARARRLGRVKWRVLRDHFGLNGSRPQTFKAIGERLGLTRERIRQIQLEAVAELREAMADG